MGMIASAIAMAVGYVTKQAAESVVETIKEVGTPMLKSAAKRVGQVFTIYLGETFFYNACESSKESVNKYCSESWISSNCAISHVERAASCTARIATWAIAAFLVYDGTIGQQTNQINEPVQIGKIDDN